MQTIDYIVFFTYFILVSAYGIWIYKRKQRSEASTTDFFLAEGSLTWWAIGASLIASNISAEQFVGMSGEGFNVGIAIACYEWIAAIALIIVAVFFMPVYLKNHIFTMPQFLKTRYNETTATIMTIFWLFLYVFVNLTSILYLGAMAIVPLVGNASFAGLDSFQWTIILMSLFAVFITIGGMKVIGYTDVIQVLVLIIGGLATTYLALTLVSQAYGGGLDAWNGWKQLLANHDDHFHMIFPKPGEGADQKGIDRYLLLPGIAMYLAGQWIVNLNYWGCNQYITQRALGADLQTARTGILFAGFLKLMMPIIVMLPGICAYALNAKGVLTVESKDSAYASILLQLQPGLKGLAAAALTAAIVASLAGKLNSISTIFTLDVYKKFVNPQASEATMVWTGRVVIWLAMALAIGLTWKDTLGIGGEGGFTYIQKYTGYVSPGVFSMFILGMFWKRTSGAAAIVGVVLGFLVSVFFDNFATTWWGTNTWLYDAFPNGKTTASGAPMYEIPFLIWMGINFVITMLAMIGVSLLGPKVNPKAFHIDSSMFKLQPITVVQIVATFMILSALYVKFW